MIAGPATPLTIWAITSSSVMDVKPCPTMPPSVSTSTKHAASEVLRSAPTSLTWSGTLSGVAVTRAIFMPLRYVDSLRGINNHPDAFADVENECRRGRHASRRDGPGWRHVIVPELAEIGTLGDGPLDCPGSIRARRTRELDALRPHG